MKELIVATTLTRWWLDEDTDINVDDAPGSTHVVGDDGVVFNIVRAAELVSETSCVVDSTT